jgi:tripartite ATP-independent transporter DctM subunit
MLRREPGLELSPKQSFKERVKTIGVNTRHAAFGLFAPFIILGGIYGGIFTPTEAAAVAAVYAIPVGFFVYHALSREKLIDCIIKSASQTGMIMVMLYCMMMLSRIYIMENVPQHIATFLTGISENKYVILLMVNVFLLIIGMLMDDASGVLLCAPLLFPVVTSIGVHPFHFAAIIGTNLGMGNITPPCAPLLYFAQSLGDVGFDKVIKPAIILIVFGFFPVVLLTTYLPELSLFLPRLAGFVH